MIGRWSGFEKLGPFEVLLMLVLGLFRWVAPMKTADFLQWKKRAPQVVVLVGIRQRDEMLQSYMGIIS